jgi:hypothetical protein
MRAVALGRPAASVDELPIAPRYLRADLASNLSPCLLMALSGRAILSKAYREWIAAAGIELVTQRPRSIEGRWR